MDNAIVNARILERMSCMAKSFLNLRGFDCRSWNAFDFSTLDCWSVSQIDPISALKLALEKGNPNTVRNLWLYFAPCSSTNRSFRWNVSIDASLRIFL